MNGQDRANREKILEAATALIRESGDAGRVTIREVARRSGVGLGLVNYYFGTKEKLLEACVRSMISSVVERFAGIYGRLDVTPLEQIRYLAKSTATFFAFNPGLSRVSVLQEYRQGHGQDNTGEIVRVFAGLILRLYGETGNPEEAFLKAHCLVSALQGTFLRADTLKEETGLDFFEDNQREQLIDRLIAHFFPA